MTSDPQHERFEKAKHDKWSPYRPEEDDRPIVKEVKKAVEKVVD